MPTRVLIMGAAGRDFHNFNTVYRDDPGSDVVAFTATRYGPKTRPSPNTNPQHPSDHRDQGLRHAARH